MNRYIAQGDGFPADNDFLMFIQDIITQVSQLASIGGEFYIIKGCEIAGGNVNPGWMVLNGEPIYFEGGALGAQVTIIENIEQVSYLEDLNNDGQGDSKNAYFSRVARFGNNGVATFDWSDIERINPLAELSKRVLPPGTNPQLYSGSVNNIPSGWQLCDGTNNTPDLRGKFIVGYHSGDTDYNAIGKQGGLKQVTLTEQQIPSHTHTGSTNSAGAHTHGIDLNINAAGDGIPALERGNSVQNQNFNTKSAGAHTHTITLNNTGGGQAHENRPPYYTLAYIIYVG